MKYKYVFIILVLGIVISALGITYSYLRVDKVQENDNIINTLSCLSITLEQQEAITLNHAIPITDEEAMNTLIPQTFKLKNNCRTRVTTNINLESLPVDNQLNKDYIKVWLNSDGMTNPVTSIVGLLPDRTPLIEGASSNYLTTIDIEPFATKEISLKLWIDYNVTSEQGFNKTYEGKLAFIASPMPGEYEDTIYAVRRNIDSESSAWERIEDSVGLVANAQIGETLVQNDFDNIYPWNTIDTYSLNLETKEEISLKEVGVENFPFDGSHGEILTRIPEFYYNRFQTTENDGNTYEYIMISPEEKEGFTKSESFSVGRYIMSGSATAVHSKSGVKPFVSKTITNFRTYAKALGSDFGQLDYRHFIIQLLYLVEYADYNSQAKLGLGYSVSNSATIASGGCNTLGMKSGTTNNNGKYSVIYRGIEDIYGNVWVFVDGINIKDYITYTCYDPNQYAVDTFTGCYQPLAYTNLNENGKYISKLGYDSNNPLISMPIASGGTDTTYLTDYYWSASSNTVALVGGSYAQSSKIGIYSWNIDEAPTYTGSTIGARLLRYN